MQVLEVIMRVPEVIMQAELEKVLNIPSILKLVMEMFLKSAVIFKSRTDFLV